MVCQKIKVTPKEVYDRIKLENNQIGKADIDSNLIFLKKNL